MVNDVCLLWTGIIFTAKSQRGMWEGVGKIMNKGDLFFECIRLTINMCGHEKGSGKYWVTTACLFSFVEVFAIF